jgi:hypothetical protein
MQFIECIEHGSTPAFSVQLAKAKSPGLQAGEHIFENIRIGVLPAAHAPMHDKHLTIPNRSERTVPEGGVWVGITVQFITEETILRPALVT